jgi:hypothetical protein
VIASHSDDMMEKTTIVCRLCSGPSRKVFSQTILQKYEVGYCQCDHCSSLQTEDAYWLHEAYASHLSYLDTGAAQRNLTNLAVCFIVSKLYKLRNIIDFGGGDGLLCRPLRGYGLNCFVRDKYTTPTYAQGFTEPDFQRADLVIAFEVLEHFPSPKKDLNEPFALDARAVFVSTVICRNQRMVSSPRNRATPVLSQREGLIADRYGYGMLANGDFIQPIVCFKRRNVARPGMRSRRSTCPPFGDIAVERLE